MKNGSGSTSACGRQAAVEVIDLKTGQVMMTNWPAEEHPCEMVLSRSGERALRGQRQPQHRHGVRHRQRASALETIWAAFYPGDPPGATPNSLALSPDEKTLVCRQCQTSTPWRCSMWATPGKSRSLGFIPVGWYPTSVRVTPDGRHLLVANGKGVTPKANPLGPAAGQEIASAIHCAALSRAP